MHKLRGTLFNRVEFYVQSQKSLPAPLPCLARVDAWLLGRLIVSRISVCAMELPLLSGEESALVWLSSGTAERSALALVDKHAKKGLLLPLRENISSQVVK